MNFKNITMDLRILSFYFFFFLSIFLLHVLPEAESRGNPRVFLTLYQKQNVSTARILLVLARVFINNSPQKNS